ncbi:putative aldouronate transport system permease protein [Paenibacillus sp. UNCCL117]|uniref:carbohydrate ABC transporter permease n=1 Tax=unclassified Paenibacillus TaxID=185978 RepID=UPI00088CAAAD|nr:MULTISPECIES: carbohydrate ABC transporter permease [unclassified Paenibacillus]SDE40302.1 putative aldouronate transport system permease protein [Paenibacillus sp. cl123]SFW65320.1 putative aldouronate transport system permease protein [Paenibacillus sp. UNCCL117]
MKRKLSLFACINSLILLGVIMVTLYPFIHMAAVSLSSNVHVLRGEVSLLPKGFTFDMYKVVLNDPRIGKAYWNTFVYVTLGTVISLIVTSLGAYALGKKTMLFHRGFTLLIIFTMFFSGGMIPTFLIVKELGIMDTVWGMVLPGAVSTWNLLIMRTFFANVPVELEESGKMDGLNDIGVFFRIVVPVSQAVFATIGLFYAVAMWNNFMLPLLYLRNPDLFPLQVILRNIVLAGQLNQADAAAVGADSVILEESLKYATIMVSTVPILLAYPFLQKYFVKGAMIGAVKG